MKLNLVSNIPNYPSIAFLQARLMSQDYRGLHLSQHNRYDSNDIYIMLNLFYGLVNNKLMQIRTTDLKNRPTNLPGEQIYAEYTRLVTLKLGRGTQDSIRKTLFVDFNRMGLINRFDPKGRKISPFQKGKIKYVSLNETALNFIDPNNNIVNRSMSLSKSIDLLLKGLPSQLFQILIQLEYITLIEFTFFVSFLGLSLNGKTYSETDLINFVIEYRNLSKFQKDFIEKEVQAYCIPSNFSGNKNNKWDFHNWLNESQQIFTLLDNVAYFEYDKQSELLRFKANSTLLNSGTPLLRVKRSLLEKQKYFANHKVTKQLGYELHHIVPLFWARNPVEFDILDTWENFIYIDGKTHCIITQSGSFYTKLDFLSSKVILSDSFKKSIELDYPSQALYDIHHQNLMLNKNIQLLKSF